MELKNINHMGFWLFFLTDTKNIEWARAINMSNTAFEWILTWLMVTAHIE